MAAHRSASVSARLGLVVLCALVASTGIAWQAWDMFGPARRPMLQGWDDSFYYFWLPSVVIDRDLDFSNQLVQTTSVHDSAREDALTMPRTDTGFVANKYPPGWALGSLPFFLLAHAIAPAGATGFEPVYLLSVWLGQLLYAIAGLWFAVRLLQRWFPPALATSAVLLVWLASPLIYYQSVRLSMSHSQVFALAMAVFWLALRIDDGDARRRTWALLGLAAALLIVTRNVAVVYLAMPGWILARRLRSWSAAAWLALGAAGPLALQLLAWKLLYGSWFTYSYGGERFDFTNLHVVEILFSPLHGWFHWHPLLLPAIVAFALWAARRTFGLCWLGSLAVAVLLNAAWPTWWLGSSFGYRGLEVPVFFAMIGLGVILSAVHERALVRRLTYAVTACAIIWNLALLALFLTQRIPRQAPVTFGDALRALGAWINGGG